MVRLPFSVEADLPAAVVAVREAVAAHGVVAVPTETFYGLSVAPSDGVSVARIFALKGRSARKALPVAGASLAQLSGLVRVPERWRERLEAAWPAPVTVVLPTVVPLPAGYATLAVRVPDHPLLCALLEAVGPLTVTSANPSGGAPLARAEEVASALGHDLALLLDGGDTPGGVPSTLVDLTGEHPRLLRQGAWTPPPGWGVRWG
jgi:L-threonylcarbamoyladenylate synthase